MITCLVGSTRFMPQLNALAARLTLDGETVLKPHVVKSRAMHAPWSQAQRTTVEGVMETMIAMSDRVHVCNVGDYIGRSTLRHIDLARRLNKPVTYEWPHSPPSGDRCPLCAGTGERRIITNGEVEENMERCPRCDGSGRDIGAPEGAGR